MGKIRLLWYADSPAASTGFGRVSQGILENLYQTNNYDIYMLGINHPLGDPHKYEGILKIFVLEILDSQDQRVLMLKPFLIRKNLRLSQKHQKINRLVG